MDLNNSYDNNINYCSHITNPVNYSVNIKDSFILQKLQKEPKNIKHRS